MCAKCPRALLLFQLIYPLSGFLPSRVDKVFLNFISERARLFLQLLILFARTSSFPFTFLRTAGSSIPSSHKILHLIWLKPWHMLLLHTYNPNCVSHCCSLDISLLRCSFLSLGQEFKRCALLDACFCIYTPFILLPPRPFNCSMAILINDDGAEV